MRITSRVQILPSTVLLGMERRSLGLQNKHFYLLSNLSESNFVSCILCLLLLGPVVWSWWCAQMCYQGLALRSVFLLGSVVWSW